MSSPLKRYRPGRAHRRSSRRRSRYQRWRSPQRWWTYRPSPSPCTVQQGVQEREGHIRECRIPPPQFQCSLRCAVQCICALSSVISALSVQCAVFSVLCTVCVHCAVFNVQSVHCAVCTVCAICALHVQCAAWTVCAICSLLSLCCVHCTVCAVCSLCSV